MIRKGSKLRGAFAGLMLVGLLWPAGSIVAQDACEPEIEKKAQKYFDMGTDRKKYKKPERMEYLRKAVEMEPEFWDARFFLAKEMIKSARYSGASYRPAEKHLLAIVEGCPSYHYEPYNLLASIALGRKEYSRAVELYETYFNLSAEAEVYSDEDDKAYAEILLDYQYAKFYHNNFSNPKPFSPSIVSNVSSAGQEYLPLITPDNNYMFFTRKTERKTLVRGTSFQSDKIAYDERFVKSKGQSGNFNAGDEMPFPFNQKEEEKYGGATISVDNKHIYLTVCKPATRKTTGALFNNCDIYVSDFVYGYNETHAKEMWYWTELRNLGPNVNTDEGWESQPSLSGDGQTLYFASARKGSLQMDIYKSELDATGNWGPAERLPEPINTEYNDKTPFIHSDSRTLYFASDGHLGFGGYDVYFVRQNEDGTWKKPENLGYPINTEKDEHGFIVSTDGQMVYFASDQLKQPGGGGLDIYTFELYEEAKPEEVVFLSGTVETKDNKPAKNARLEIKNMKTKKVTTVKVDQNDGRFAAVAVVEKDADLVVSLKGDNVAFNSRLIPSQKTREKAAKTRLKVAKSATVAKDTVHQTFYEMNPKLETVKVGQPYRLNDIFFRTNSADLSEESTLILDEFATYLKENPGMRVGIYGHTDNVGDAKANKALSWERAFAVKSYLEEKGVGGKRLEFDGFGPDRPIASNSTPTGRAQNRRTEFTVLSL